MHFDDIRLMSGETRFGHLEEIQNDRFAFFHRLNRECGDLGRIRAMAKHLLFVNSPELLHEVFVEKAESFIKSPALRGALRPLAGQGLFTSEGALWKRQRRLMAPLFTRTMIAAYADTMAACAEESASTLREGAVIDAARLTTHVAMRVAGRALLDAETAEEADEIGEALTVALSWANVRSGEVSYAAQLQVSALVQDVAEGFPGLPQSVRARGLALADTLIEPIQWPGKESRALQAALATINRHVERMIAARRASGLVKRDLLSLLLATHDEGGEHMTDKQVRDEIVTLFVAGHETTASSLAWALYLLARNPEAYARAKAEAAPFRGRRIRAEDLPKLGYCLRVFKEAMRLYPPVYFFGRQAIEPVRMGEYDLPRGAVVLISTYALQRRAEIWPNPETFDPSRFEKGAEDARHRQAYLPFGAGPRTCIGNHFALMEGPIVLATLLARADLAQESDRVVEPDATATLRPRGSISLRVTKVHAAA